MSDKQIILLVGGAIVAALIVWIIILIVKDYKKGKAENRREKVRETEEKMLNDIGTVTSLHAEVVDMSCGVTSIGYQNFKQPRAEKYFIIALQYYVNCGKMFWVVFLLFFGNFFPKFFFIIVTIIVRNNFFTHRHIISQQK